MFANEQAVSVFKCLGDKTRLDIIAMLRDGESYPELLASRLSLTSGTVSFHLKKLESAGLVSSARSQFYMIYTLNREITAMTIDSFITTARQDSGEDKYKKQVINNFIVNGRLKNIPSQLKKREIIWELITGDFDLGRTYTEKEVNEVILKYHDDFCTIRRELIGLGFMKRDREIYTRLK